MTEVVAALIWKGNRFLICLRPAHKARGLLWEFVGGKVEPGRPRNRLLYGNVGKNWPLRFRWERFLWKSLTNTPT